jgi:hypothetical protein
VRRGADQFLGGPAGHGAQTRVGAEDDPSGGDGSGALVHRFQDEPVRAIGAGQSVDLLLSGWAGHRRVDDTAADRFDDPVGLTQLCPHFSQFRGLHTPFPGLSRREAALIRDLGPRLSGPGQAIPVEAFANSGLTATAIKPVSTVLSKCPPSPRVKRH